MDKRIGMQNLNCACRKERIFYRTPQRLACCNAKCRTDSLSAGKHAVSHRFMKLLRLNPAFGQKSVHLRINCSLDSKEVMFTFFHTTQYILKVRFLPLPHAPRSWVRPMPQACAWLHAR